MSLRRSLRAIPAPIWALGMVSLLMDASSEMIHGLLPVFMTTVLGASGFVVGMIEGIAEATTSITKVFSGFLSDRIQKRKSLVILGYGLSALTKPLFALAPTLGWVLSARFADRFGKGIRGSPRDALIADIAPENIRGACYGLRQSLDTVGAIIGPLLAIALMAVSQNDFRLVFWLAIIPALLCVAVLAKGVKEPERHHPANGSLIPKWSEFRSLGRGYWRVMGLGALINLARFSEAFLILRLQELGLALSLAPFVLIVMNIVFALAAFPAGRYSDRLGSRGLLTASLGVLVLSDLVMTLNLGPAFALLGVACWGLHMALSQGILARLIADTAPMDLRGTAFGLYHLAAGICLLTASTLAGLLWDSAGSSVTFLAGGGFALAGLLAVTGLRLK
ncbi:MAG: MFS transporter [Rhodospirillales bacterium]|nr:MAG: MFS transporter [Rhodospirillales bacterium]